ncbi:tyrosine-type recombinase/integrase [Acetobacter thailandicus]|uniref:Tyrosine-type recombinase/integrase n=1 Tax=Acetobacter thailandicus TaxID=1502842 RepID=A0ABT3QHH1_9PROT|nr:tyrosine-type recombinase/integrase [Acetobacter thailandicus]MCX2564695.1 tyrosine-type recombinase/integrase [Acetobacter thailandicus]
MKAANLSDGTIFRRICPSQKNKIAPYPTLTRPKIGSTPLSDRAVADIIQKWCKVTGLEGDFSDHSLRRGAISTGAKDGYNLLELKRFSRHKSLQVVETYIDEASIKERHLGKLRF